MAAGVRLTVQLIALLVVAGGATAAHATELRLTVVSARLPLKAARSGRAPSLASLSDLACLSLPGLRAMAASCGGQKPAVSDVSFGIDPFVRVEIGDRVIRTYHVPGSLEPRWEYSAVLDRAFLDGHPQVMFQLFDYSPDGERKLGEKAVPMKELLKGGTRTLKNVGGGEITYRVEVLADGTPPRVYNFEVTATRQMAELAQNAAIGEAGVGGYVAIPVAEGEIVEVTASGTVKPSARKHPDIVSGPGGLPTKKTKIQWNQPGFRGCPGCDHAALIGQIGSTALVLGEHRQFTVESSGLLILGINDLKVEDNDGGYRVRVTVALPPHAAAPRAPERKRGGKGDSSPAALDGRVLQQVVDAHGSELDACVASEPNPNGELVLTFSISADGRPLGVIVERASPNLARAGECMRKKALSWKFPPPHGVVSARYPLSFSGG